MLISHAQGPYWGNGGGRISSVLAGPADAQMDLKDCLFCLWDDPPIRVFANETRALATYGMLIEDSNHIRPGFFWVKNIRDPESKKPPVHYVAFAGNPRY